MSTENKRLIGIKAIARYLQISERNVYRWEQDLRLPLKRIAGSKGRYVYIDVDDLEKWLRKRKLLQPGIKKKHLNKIFYRVVLFFGLFVVAFILIVFIRKITVSSNDGPVRPVQDFPNPISASIDGKIVYIKGDKGQKIWNFIADEKDLGPGRLNKHKIVNFSDFDNDYANEVISRIYSRKEDKFYLILFDNDGTELWKRNITNEQEFNGIKFESDFFPLQIYLAHLRNEENRIITYWRHRIRFLSLISCHNREGELLKKYVHTGNLGTLDTHDLDQDGDDEVIFAGTNNLLNGEGVVGVLCSTDFKGVSPPYRIEPEYTDLEYWLKSYVPDEPEYGNQIAYIRFKKTNYLTRYILPYVFATIDNIETSLIHVLLGPWRLEFENRRMGFEYVFDSEFNLRDVIPNAGMLSYYPILKKNQEIGISLEELKKVYSENVLRWQNGNWIPVRK